MTVLQIGRHRTGGYLLWKIIECILETAAHPKKSFILNHHFQLQKQKWPDLSIDHFSIDSMSVEDDGVFCDVEILLREKIVDPSAYINSCSHVWSDSYLHPRHAEILPLFGSIIYQLRDPRDSLISLAEWEFKPYRMRYGWKKEKTPAEFIEQRIEEFMIGWSEHVSGYLAIADKHNMEIVKYEDIVGDFNRTLTRIAKSIGVSLTIDEIESIREQVSLERMRAANPGHVQSGTVGRHSNIMTPSQLERIDKVCGDLIRSLGY